MLSNFNYCNHILINLSSKLQTKIQRVQNACIRFIYSLKRRDHVSPFLVKTNWLNMNSRRLLQCLCMVYKIYKNIVPSYLTLPVSSLYSQQTYFTRGIRVPIPHHKTNIKHNSFYIKSVNDFNNLPPDIVLSSSFNVFKRNVKNHLLSLQNAIPYSGN